MCVCVSGVCVCECECACKKETRRTARNEKGRKYFVPWNSESNSNPHPKKEVLNLQLRKESAEREPGEWTSEGQRESSFILQKGILGSS